MTDDVDNVRSDQATTYITAGGGGEPASLNFFPGTAHLFTAEGRKVIPATWSLPDRTSDHAVLCVDVTPASQAGQTTTMHLRAIDITNKVVDEVVLSRPGSVGARPASKPSSPALAVGLGGVGGALVLSTAAAVVQRRRDARPRLADSSASGASDGSIEPTTSGESAASEAPEGR